MKHDEAGLFRRFAGAHLVLWTLLPGLFYPNVLLDQSILCYWGRAWQWGYSKHPPLPAWLSELGCHLGHTWGLYLLSQIAIVVCFYAAWRLAKEVGLGDVALLACIALEGSYYYNYTSLEFNNNVGLMPWWAMAGWLGLRATRDGRLRDWLGLGLCFGLGLLSKYTMGVLGVVLLGFLLFDPVGRKVWRTAGPYVALLVAALLFGPHLRWAGEHDWVTIRYALGRSAEEARHNWLDHLWQPLSFTLAQLLAVVPVLLILQPGWERWSARRAAADQPWVRRYLWAIAVGPFAVHLLLSMVTGAGLRSMWGSPLWTFIAVLALFELAGDWRLSNRVHVWRRARAVMLAMVVAVVVAVVLGPYLTHKGARAQFPGRALARETVQRYEQRFGAPPSRVGGDWWLAANVSLYAPSRPSVYADLDPIESPWTSDADFRQHGGVLLWRVDEEGERLPQAWARRFPLAVEASTLSLRWQTGARVPPVVVGLALVPPEG